MVESRPVGINRVVVGSSPTSGANPELMYWVYILQNPVGKFYSWETSSLGNGLGSHNRTDKNGGHYTRKNGPWDLVWTEAHPSRASAMKREQSIKRMKSAKWICQTLLNGRVPTSRD